MYIYRVTVSSMTISKIPVKPKGSFFKSASLIPFPLLFS